ncbi:acidic leucine-rich nuclear phosphoprotein 32-related protein isoform X2 [Phalaenopsis equestris]|uniref:acidic leucine-rich nuclear phosphoprotein 32-related protein isoform X2 n=1 Tax=Phalaenopsis equestris TaxID=78828 RepID=UPI0009E5B9D9|nr:acidic leucine-rich nuclear phosphoprotein 32-related protein isoform X2 [Phalaenopsis equestris]
MSSGPREPFSLFIVRFRAKEKEAAGICYLLQFSFGGRLRIRNIALIAEVVSWMEEAWERAIEAKLEGLATPFSELRVLNLDGAVKSLHGCLPPAGLLERFPGLEHLSIANVGAYSLERFPRLRNLQRLILSDNRIGGGLESLVDAGLRSLRDLDLSNNRIQLIEDLAPLASLHLVSVDLYECPVTRVKDYRSKVFSLIPTLKYLDKLDANGNERPETDEEEEEEEDEEEEYDDDEEDSGSGEVDGGDQNGKLTSGAENSADGDEGIVDADDDEGSDADEEEIETNGRRTGSGSSGGSGHHISNEVRVATSATVYAEGDEHDGDGYDDVEDEDEEDDDDDLGEGVDEEEGDYEDDVAEMHNVLDSDEEDEDGVDEVEIDEEEIDEDGDAEEEEEVDEDDDELGVGDEEDPEPASTGRHTSTEGEIDGHDHGEEDENGEIGQEDEQGVEDRDAEEEDYGESEDEDDLDGDYLVQPIGQSSWLNRNAGNEDDEIDYEDENRTSNGTLNQASSSSEANKRKRDEDGRLDNDKTDEPTPSKRGTQIRLGFPIS